MKEFEVTILVQASKTMVLSAENEDDATEKAYEICDVNTIPIEPDDMPEIWIGDIKEHHHENTLLDD
jgi:hypothetical protein